MKAETQIAVLPLLILGVAAIGSNSLALSPILTDVARSLAATPVDVARSNAAYGGATAASALLLGPAVDRVGPRRMVTIGFSLMSAAMLGSACATGWAGLAAAQGLAGVAAGLTLPAIYAYAVVAAPAGREAETMGRVLTGWSVSLVAGVPLSAVIAGAAGWRASYLVLGALQAAVAAGFIWVRDPPSARASGGDRSLWPALKTAGVARLLGVCFAFMTAFYGMYAYFGDHLHSLGASSGMAGLVVLTYGIGFGLAVPADRAVDRLGVARLLPLVLGVLAVIYALMIPGASSLGALAALALCWGFANHVGLNGLVLLLGRADESRRGAVLALNSAVSYAGALVGVGVFGTVYESGGFTAAAALAAGCLAGGTALARTGEARDRATTP